MFNKSDFSVVLPQAVKCTSGTCETGMLVPILCPITVLCRDVESWGSTYEVYWKCTECNKIIRAD